MAHSVRTYRNEALSCIAYFVIRTWPAVNFVYYTAFTPKANVLAFTRCIPANLRGFATFPAVNAFNSSTFTASADILTETGILPANLRHARAGSTVDALESAAFLSGADVLADACIQSAYLSGYHAGAAALAADGIRAAMAARAIRNTGSASGVAAGIFAD